MNSLQKRRIKSVLKYTWPFYLLSALVLVPSIYFIFIITHRLPAYKTLTLFVSGDVIDNKKLEKDLLERYKDNNLKEVTTISARPTESIYQTKLSVAGYNTADILIIPVSKLNDLEVYAFGLDLPDELTNSYYAGYTLYEQKDVHYGIKVDKEKTKEYFTLPSEDCYMILNGNSQNTGEYSNKQIKEHDNALRVVKDWGM